MFSTVSSAFVIDVQSKLESDPSERSAALLLAILITLDQSAVPGESPTAPPIHEDPPGVITAALGLMYVSLFISLLAAFIAMLGKQWLNRYMRNRGGSAIERCGDRQRKLEGLERWPFHTFVESLPVMLQIALLLLACGLCLHMEFINTSIANILVALTVLGISFYLGIVIAGTSSYECPFQTAASIALRDLWKKIRPRMTPVALPVIDALRGLWKVILYKVLSTTLRLRPKLDIWRQFHCSGPQNIGEESPAPWLAALCNLWKKIRSGIPQVALRLPPALKSTLHHSSCLSLPTIQSGLPVPQENTPWLAPKDLAAFLESNASDVRCVSWILRSVTDLEAVDAAVRLAGTIRWFEDGTNVEPPYYAILSAFEACFDSTKKVYPGLEGRAYYSVRAMLWIHTLAGCKSQEFAERFPLPVIKEDLSAYQDDKDELTHLLTVCSYFATLDYDHLFRPASLYTIPHGASYLHAQWTSNLLLHIAWTRQDNPTIFRWFSEFSRKGYRYDDWDAIPLDVTLNRFLIWSIFLGSPIEEEVLRIQNKSYVVSYPSLQVTYTIIH